MSEILVTPPTAQPVTAADMMVQLGMGPVTDNTLASSLGQQLSGYLSAALAYCQNYTRSVYLTQTWQILLDGFSRRGGRSGLLCTPLLLPKPPFVALESLQYIDLSGTVQALPQDLSYGADPNLPAYAFELDAGDETKPARLRPAYSRPWPPTRWVQNTVIVQFKCGFGGPVQASLAANSAVLSGPVFLAGEVGRSVTVPGAGTNSAALNTTIATIDQYGVATLATPAVSAVANAAVWIGRPVPAEVLQAIKFMAQFFYEQGAVVDVPIPRVVAALLGPYRNMVS